MYWNCADTGRPVACKEEHKSREHHHGTVANSVKSLILLRVRDRGPQVGAQYKAAEVMKCEWELVQQSPVWAVDAWGMGCLMQEAFSGRPLARTEDLRNTSAIPQAVLQARLPALGS